MIGRSKHQFHSLALFLSLLFITYSILGDVVEAAAPSTISECEKRSHSSFTASQKKELCSKAPSSYGPAICGSVAKSSLHLKFDTILELCGTASSAAPANCMSKLDATLRTKVGVELCSAANSTLPGECLVTLSKLKDGNKLKTDKRAISFCRELVDLAPMSCVDAVTSTGLKEQPFNVLEECANSVGSGDAVRNTSANMMVYNCIQTMSSMVNPSQGLTPKEIIKFCAIGSQHLLDERNRDKPSKSASASDLSSIFSSTSWAEGLGTASNVLARAWRSWRSYFFHQITGSEWWNADEDEGSSESIAAACFVHSGQIKELAAAMPGKASNTNIALSMQQRLKLCSGAQVAKGPINCAIRVLWKGDRSSFTGISADHAVSLCSRATGTGPAECLAESKSGCGDKEARVELCNGATNSGPAKCYRRSAAAFRKDKYDNTEAVVHAHKMLLCVDTLSDDPANCAASAPQYLTNYEKVDLCSHTPVSRAQDPVNCLNAIQKLEASRSGRGFKNSPKKMLGHFMENLSEEAEGESRALVVNMCSFSASVDPIASAECYKSASTELNHDDAVRMCTGISSAEVIEYMSLCHKLLPVYWPSSAASVLCKHTYSRPHVEEVVQCALETVKAQYPKMSVDEAAQVCSTEGRSRPTREEGAGGGGAEGQQQDDEESAKNARNAAKNVKKSAADASGKVGPVLSCVRSVINTVQASSPGASLVTPQSLIDTCSYAPSGSEAGKCLKTLSTFSSAKFIFDSGVTVSLCTSSPNPSDIIDCLEQSNVHLVTHGEVKKCMQQEKIISTVRLSRIYTEDNDIKVTAGRRFSVWFSVFDQWNRPFKGKPKEVMFTASVNMNNKQGAVLWGIRSNYTENGVVEFNSLVISQPGEIEFKLHYLYTSAASSSSAAAHKSGKAQEVQIFRMTVLEDPARKEIAPCLYVFQDSMCPSAADAATNDRVGEDWVAEFPRIRSLSPAIALNQVFNVSSSSNSNSNSNKRASPSSSSAGVGLLSVVSNGVALWGTRSNYMSNLVCADQLAQWGVNAYMLPDGSMWTEYKLGVDAVWTGIGMPRMEHTAMQRLDLHIPSLVAYQQQQQQRTGSGQKASSHNSNNNNNKEEDTSDAIKSLKSEQKTLKRAYYKKSLQWHPDRWVGLSQYAVAVQAAFELIREAYEELSAEMDALIEETTNGNKEGEDGPAAAAAVFA